ncbi:MAG: PGF-CTERM sorting domain-containing protein [Methanocellales archaeon]|nr:PGF-CTERM sorting domain-containing protein [Methanocellales archaeon]
MNKKTSLLSILLVTIALCAPAAAIPQIPNQFYGRVTIDESPAADGLTVSAWIDGVEYASTTTSGGTYGTSSASVFLVPADDAGTPEKEGGVSGETVEFYVGGVRAGEAIFVSGGVTELDLTASGVPSPTPTPTATTTPTGGGAAGGGGGGGGGAPTSTMPTPTPTVTPTPTATPATTPTPTVTPTSEGAPIPPSTPEAVATRIREPPTKILGITVPGFEAIFAIIGLLAVAYLTRRR